MPFIRRAGTFNMIYHRVFDFLCDFFYAVRCSPRARNRFYQVVEAKRFEGVFLCRKVC